jgi:2,4-dienoyl-CoA reductase-like NADH-dependent reductase (Old Yellow Enzyme family)
MPHLFDAFTLRELTFKNRVFLSPMCQYAAQLGHPTDWHKVHYGARAVGGVGLVLQEATAVAPEGRSTLGDLGLWTDAQAVAYRSITRFIRSQGAVPGVQLTHAGRKASLQIPSAGGAPLAAKEGGWNTVSASPLAFDPKHPPPQALDAQGLAQVAGQFAAATRRASSAGFDVVELHMAHGHLLHSFLSPLSNRRDDEYGGSFNNRTRFPLEVAKQVREAWPAHLPLFARISATDWAKGGWDMEQSIRFCRLLREAGVDFIDASSGGLLPEAEPPATPGHQAPFAAAIKKHAGIATGAVGLITEADQAEQIVAKGWADAVLLGRELLRNPYWPLQAAAEIEIPKPIAWPKAYLRAKG